MCTVPVSVTAPGPLQSRFLAILPVVEKHARFAFRALVCGQEREDAVAEVIALVWHWYCRLINRGKNPHDFIITLASFASRHVKAGRRLCGTDASQDVLSRPAQRRHGFKVEQLEERGDYEDPAWQEALTDNTVTPPPEAAAFRIDFPRWLAGQAERDRRLIGEMALGETTSRLARRFGVSPGRVSQKRREYQQDWERFCGEEVLAAA
jgi:DNA-directed RNA polymerase specialized sigma24 family protein